MVDSTLPKDYSVALKGLLSLFIVGTHISARLLPEETFLWLRLSALLTPLSLVFFFFLSGYGLMTQHRLRTLRTPSATPSELWKGWLTRRLWGLVKPFLFFYVVAVFFLFAGNGFDLSWSSYAMRIYFRYWGIGVPGPLTTAWFLWELFILYTLYYVSFRYVCWITCAVLILSISLLLLVFFVWLMGFGDYWLRYPLVFVIGVAYAHFEKRIYTQVKSHSLLALGCLLLLGGVYVWSMLTFPAPHIAANILGHLAYYPIPVLCFALSKAWGVTDFAMKRIDRGLIICRLRWLGEISLEVYLLHIIFVNFYRSAVFSIESPLLYMLAVYASSLLGAYLIARYLGRWVRA